MKIIHLKGALTLKMEMRQSTARVENQKVLQTVEALLAFDKKKKTGVTLFEEDENDKIELQVSVWHIGGKKTKTVPLALPHCMYEKNRDALLFVKDMNKMSPDMCEHHFRDLLTEKGVKGVSKVMPYKVLRLEYKPFEAKRNLAKSYDVFLTDDRIFKGMSRHIGKEFYKRNKYPIPVNLEMKNLKEKIAEIMNTVYINLSNRGSCSSANVANVGMSPENIAANVIEAVTIIGKEIAGGWDNIKAIHLKTKKSISLPIYTNLIQPQPKRNFQKTTDDTFLDTDELPNKNEDLDNLELQLKLEKVKAIESLRRKKDLHPSEMLKMKRPKTATLFKAKYQKGQTRKQRKDGTKRLTPKQKLIKKRMDAKLREKE